MKIIIGEQLINYTDEGKGDVILMLHGWGANLHSFDEMTKWLARKYRVVRLDLPGFGGSPRPTEDWHIGDYAQMVTDFLDKKNINVHAAIVHSFGGRVIIKAVGNGMIDVDKLVLMGSGGIKHSNSPRQTMYKAIAKTGKGIMKLPGINRLELRARAQLYKTAKATDYIESNELKQIFLNAINEDMRDVAVKIKVPTLLLWGSQDQDTPIADAQIFHTKIKNSKLVILPGAGHFVYLDDADGAKSAIESFLS